MATSFSTLGVALILAVGGTLIICNVVLELVVSNISTRSYKRLRWALDDKLQLQRLAFEGAGLGTWNAGIGAVPATTSGELFGVEVCGGKSHATIASSADIGEDGDIALTTMPERMEVLNQNSTTVHPAESNDDLVAAGAAQRRVSRLSSSRPNMTLQSSDQDSSRNSPSIQSVPSHRNADNPGS